jgi:Tol biopolymer transport system component
MAFSCEHGGSTQIHVMEWPGGQELELTSGDCNSISPAWAADSKRLIYATDCGRGLGLTALAEVSALR